jgi:hypothetical protein
VTAPTTHVTKIVHGDAASTTVPGERNNNVQDQEIHPSADSFAAITRDPKTQTGEGGSDEPTTCDSVTMATMDAEQNSGSHPTTRPDAPTVVVLRNIEDCQLATRVIIALIDNPDQPTKNQTAKPSGGITANSSTGKTAKTNGSVSTARSGGDSNAPSGGVSTARSGGDSTVSSSGSVPTARSGGDSTAPSKEQTALAMGAVTATTSAVQPATTNVTTTTNTTPAHIAAVTPLPAPGDGSTVQGASRPKQQKQVATVRTPAQAPVIKKKTKKRECWLRECTNGDSSNARSSRERNYIRRIR